MKCVVEISIDFPSGIQPGCGRAEIRIWTEIDGIRNERGPFLIEENNITKQRLEILAVNWALNRFKKTGQEITIRMSGTYVYPNLQYLDRWHEQEFRRAGKRILANEDQWRKLWMHMHIQKITIENAAV